MPNTQPIAVLGAGSWGSALALVAAENGPVHLWSHRAQQAAAIQLNRVNPDFLPGVRFPDNIFCSDDLAKTLSGCQDVLLVVPSHAFRAVLQQLKPFLTDGMRIAWATKGVEPDTHQFFHEVVAEEVGATMPVAIISGPSFAKEVAAKKPTAVAIAGNDTAFVEDLVSRFHTHYMRLYINHDMVGVQLCGALKNVFAIAAGIADGMGLGSNTLAALMTRGMDEMRRFCLALGGQDSTTQGLAGIGDLILTCSDNQSRNRRFGYLVGLGKSIDSAKLEVGQVVEGLYNTKQVYGLSQAHQVDAPIVNEVYCIIFNGKPPEQAVVDLLQRPLKTEG